MAKAIRRKGETLESLMKRFNRAVNEEGIMKRVREKGYYETRGQKERRLKKEYVENLRSFR